MRKTTHLIILCLAVGVLFSSCVGKKKYTELLDNKAALDKMLSETKDKVKSLEGDIETLAGEKTTLESEKEGLQQRIVSLEADKKAYEDLKITHQETQTALTAKEEKILELSQTIKGVFANAQADGLNVTEKGDRLFVSTGEPILFRSGSTSLQKKYKETIASLANVLKSNPSMKIQIEGHTDAKKMKQGARYVSNWELSTARAMSLVYELVKSGVSETQVAAVGKGEFHPITTEDSSDARAMNRRVEIVVLPSVRDAYKFSKEGV